MDLLWQVGSCSTSHFSLLKIFRCQLESMHNNYFLILTECFVSVWSGLTLAFLDKPTLMVDFGEGRSDCKSVLAFLSLLLIKATVWKYKIKIIVS